MERKVEEDKRRQRQKARRPVVAGEPMKGKAKESKQLDGRQSGEGKIMECKC